MGNPIEMFGDFAWIYIVLIVLIVNIGYVHMWTVTDRWLHPDIYGFKGSYCSNCGDKRN